MVDHIGQQLGNYRLVSLLGEGGFAEVYLGEHIHLGTQAAIKVLHTQLTSDDMEQFRTEARTIARLEHPHIVRVLDFGVEGKIPFLVMGYAPNGTLRHRHPKGAQLSLTTIVSYVKQVADALQYAHDAKLIHRDIKPENMLLGKRNEVLLSDFGIAIVAQSSRYQSTQDVIGTVAYMAPEQIQGKPHLASDQYSLGIVVYEWVSGNRPFHGSFTELCTQHMFASPPPLREKVSAVSSEVEQVVQTALAKDQKERFPSIQAFADALEQASQRAQSHLSMSTSTLNQPLPPTQVAPPSANPTFPPTVIPPPSNQLLSPTQLATPSNLSIKPTEMVLSLNQPIQPTTDAISSGQTQQPSIVTTSQSHPQWSKRGISRRTLVVGGLAGLVVVSGVTWLALTQRLQVTFPSHHPTATPSGPPLGTMLFTYRGHTNRVIAVPWSPDGTRIASGSIDKTVQVWDASDGSNTLTYRGHTDGVLSVAWSPDGKHIASGSDDKTVQVWDASDGSNTFTYRGHSARVTAVCWSPDGTRITSGSWDKTVQVWDASDGSNTFTYRGHSDRVVPVAWSPDGTRIASGGWDRTAQVWQAL